MPDYRELLKHYIAHIVANESIDYIDSRWSGMSELSEVEKQELRGLAAEVEAEVEARHVASVEAFRTHLLVDVELQKAVRLATLFHWKPDV